MTVRMEPIAIPDHVVLPAGSTVRPLPALGLDASAIAELAVRTDRYGATTIREILDRFECRSLVVVHRGGLAYEWYATERDATARHACFSVTKSFTGTLAAIAVHEGTLDRAARVRDLIPELAETGFGSATVGDVADMAVAIAYDEDYEEGATSQSTTLGFGDYLAALTGETAGEIRGLLARIRAGAGEHGNAFAYATPVSDVLAWLLERATGTAYCDLLRDRIWSHVGAEHDAILTMTPDGTPIAGGGLALTTRDLARCRHRVHRARRRTSGSRRVDACQRRSRGVPARWALRLLHGLQLPRPVVAPRHSDATALGVGHLRSAALDRTGFGSGHRVPRGWSRRQQRTPRRRAGRTVPCPAGLVHEVGGAGPVTASAS